MDPGFLYTGQGADSMSGVGWVSCFLFSMLWLNWPVATGLGTINLVHFIDGREMARSRGLFAQDHLLALQYDDAQLPRCKDPYTILEAENIPVLVTCGLSQQRRSPQEH